MIVGVKGPRPAVRRSRKTGCLPRIRTSTSRFRAGRPAVRRAGNKLADTIGFEPTRTSFVGWGSVQLSYVSIRLARPTLAPAGDNFVSCSRSPYRTRHGAVWLRRWESNPRRTAYETAELPLLHSAKIGLGSRNRTHILYAPNVAPNHSATPR